MRTTIHKASIIQIKVDFVEKANLNFDIICVLHNYLANHCWEILFLKQILK